MDAGRIAMLLTESEIEHLTGYTQTAAQSRWLNKEGMAHKINARGEIVITWEVVNRALSGNRVSEPRWENA